MNVDLTFDFHQFAFNKDTDADNFHTYFFRGLESDVLGWSYTNYISLYVYPNHYSSGHSFIKQRCPGFQVMMHRFKGLAFAPCMWG